MKTLKETSQNIFDDKLSKFIGPYQTFELKFSTLEEKRLFSVIATSKPDGRQGAIKDAFDALLRFSICDKIDASLCVELINGQKVFFKEEYSDMRPTDYAIEVNEILNYRD